MITIQKNVPISSPMRKIAHPKGRPLKYKWPISEMKVKDSIFIPITELPERARKGLDAGTHYTHNAVRAHLKRYKMQRRIFSHRQMIGEDNKPIGVRIWRIR